MIAPLHDIFAAIGFALVLMIGFDAVDQRDARETARAARSEELDQLERYSAAIASCLNGRGFLAGQRIVLCDVTDVVPAGETARLWRASQQLGAKP